MIDLKYTISPSYIFRALGYEPSDWQSELMDDPTPLDMAVISRQGGKTLTSACIGVHSAIVHNNSLSANVAGSEKQAMEWLRKAKQACHVIGAQLKRNNQTEIELSNGSRLLALSPTDSARGLSNCEFLSLDEAALILPETIAAVVPTTASAEHGRILAISSARANGGWFHDVWSSADDAWRKIWRDHTSITHQTDEMKQRMESVLGSLLFKAEFGSEFVDDSDPFITNAAFVACRNDNFQSIFAEGYAA